MTPISTPDAAGAYETLAPFYDRFTAHHDYDLWTGGLLHLAYRHGLSGRRALDAGCGTGKSFLPLLERGFEVTGCDQSAAMLEVAASNAGPHRVTLHCRDLRALDPIGEFDLITCLDDVANYLTEPEELAAALAGLAANLRPGGLLLFDANTLGTYRGFFSETAVLEEQHLMMVWRGLATSGSAPAISPRPRSTSSGRAMTAGREPRAATTSAITHGRRSTAASSAPACAAWRSTARTPP